MSAQVIEVGLDQALNQLMQLQGRVNDVVLAGMLDAANECVELAKANATSSMRMRTGRLVSSLGILSQQVGATSVSVTVGSSLPGYPFFQEYGWTTRSGKTVPGKYYFTRAVEEVTPKIADYIMARASALAGGP
jgi:hypothetical protein